MLETNSWNVRLEESYNLFFTEPRRLTTFDYIPSDQLALSSNPEKKNLLFDGRFENGGWRPRQDPAPEIEFNLSPETILNNDPYWRIQTLNVRLVYKCISGTSGDDSADEITYTVSFLGVDDVWVEKVGTFAGKKTGYQVSESSADERTCVNPNVRCDHCSFAMLDKDVKRIRIRFDSEADFGNYDMFESSGQGYSIAEIEVLAKSK